MVLNSNETQNFHIKYILPQKERGLETAKPAVLAAGFAVSKSYCLDVQILYIQRVLFDELPAAFDIFTHQRGEDLFGRGDILELHLE